MARPTHRTAPGCTYFVTTKTWGGRSLFQVAETAEIVVEVLLRHRAAGAYHLHEFVLMPNHLHLLLTPGRTTTLEKAMQLIKGASSYEIHKRRGTRMAVWQPSFFESTIRDAQDFRAQADYIRLNPVVAKLAERPDGWPYSSAAGSFALDGWTPLFSSAAKAADGRLSTSELKLRPPEDGGMSELKRQAPEYEAMSELKLRPPKERAGR